MAHDQSQDRFKLQLYIGLVIKELRVKLFCGGQPTKLEIVAVVDLPKAEYPLVAFSKPHDQFGESPQWIRRDDAPTAIAIAPSTRIVVKVDVTIEKKTVTLVTNPTPLLNNLIGIVKTQESGEGTMNLELENAGVSKKRAEGPPQGLMRCVMSYGVPDTDRLTERGSYRLPKDAPAPDLSVAKRFEKTDSSVLTIVHAYSGIIGDIFPNGSPPLARLIRVILARLTRFHCKVNPGITFDKNPADDMVQQLKEFLILLYNAPQLKKLRVGSESIAQINSTWYHKFEELKSQEVLLGVMKRTAMDSVPGNFRVDILTEIYMAVSLLDMCMDDHHECSYDTIITRPWFGREALMRQRKLFELRVRTIFFLLRDWYIPPDVLHRTISAPTRPH
ncbi:hypothetical protein BDY19DRAFT_179842 [Irpex rosettiformis]|uniref:Uncharacterized protein n=1 Tax=Irpex rosettiformis TaxID=378272 RepID=A0ACB8U365_9APHY|nr:hypothetical protein BDY19DRAFT_179842 [Irpex rosettiformis]